MGIRAGKVRSAAGAIALTLALASPSFGGVTAEPALDPWAEAAAARSELLGLLDDFEAVALAADEAARRWMDLRLRELEVRAAEQESSRAFSDRVRSAYIAGPGHAVELVLGARDLHELAAILPYAASALDAQRLDVDELTQRRAMLEQVSRETAEAQRTLIRSEERLARLRERIDTRLARAEAAVKANAGARAALDEVRKHYQGTVDRVAGATRTIRYRKGEAMFKAAEPFLGPRADCSIPNGLRSTGDAIGGEASWYGNAFRGKPTASGAIFLPERFTVAHRTLPFGLFLLIRMGDECVVSFLNDRGPYVDGRILDLSYASAQAIGLTGVKNVTATLLVRVAG
ncbi:MAG: RlpA-like double-psi beta-barrel domain-containing protein [Actinomycetota bacterium]